MITKLWLDARIHRLLARPQMWFQGPEALFNMVFEILTMRGQLTGDRFEASWEDLSRLGLKEGNRYVLPESITDEFVQKVKEFAEEKGYDPRDFDARDAAVSDHIKSCPLCKTRMSTKIEQCEVYPKLEAYTSGHIAHKGPTDELTPARVNRILSRLALLSDEPMDFKPGSLVRSLVEAIAEELS